MRLWSAVFYTLLFFFGFAPKTALSANARFPGGAGVGVAPANLVTKVVKMGKFAYRQAVANDLGAILAIYEELETPSDDADIEAKRADDRGRIVILPMPFREDHLKDAIAKGRIFVATKPPEYRTRLTGEKIVSLLKMFIVEDEAERNTILREELRWPGSHSTAGLYSSGYQQMLVNCVFNYGRPPKFVNVPDRVYRYSAKRTIIYFGGAYTIPAYRGLQVSTLLEQFALSRLRRPVLYSIEKRKATHLDYVYGVVIANSGSIGRIRCFSDFADNIQRTLKIPTRTDEKRRLIVELESFTFNAFKPSFKALVSKRGRAILHKLDDHEDNAGFGCLLSASIEGAEFDYESDTSQNDSDDDDD
jgi:hypothetical protein